MGEARDFKFGVRIDRRAYKPENAKVDHKGHGPRHVTYLYNFCTPTTSVEWLNLQTSNLMHRLTTRGIIQKMQKLGQVDAWTHVTYF